jgi:hypothetical protein
VLLCEQLEIIGLNLFEKTMKANPPTRSTILSGSITFDEINGAQRKLRAGESVTFTRIDGELHTLTLDGDGISMLFVGKVAGLETGPAAHRVSLMPTLLEWLQARHGLALLWGSSIYVFGIVMSLMRWLQLTI